MEWHAKRVDAKDEKATSRYRTGVTAGNAIAVAIGRKPSTLFRAAHLEKNSRRKSALSPKAEKQNLEEMFAFGHALLDITDALSEEAIRGTLPIIVRLRTGQAYEEWCGNVKKPLEQLTSVNSSRDAWRYSKAAAVRERWANDNRNANRSPAINIRMEAELLIFIAQTGLNLTQAWNMQLGDFRYESINDGYGVRRYKARRLGEIEFHIYSDYRPYFERYLAWRKVMFPNEVTGLLFPFINRASEGRRGKMVFTRLISRLDRIGIKFIGPQMLRLTRINWMLRRLNDPTLTAEDHGHSLEVLHAQYERPNHQLAMIEVTNFWRSTDPAIKPPGPGVCTEQLPEVLPTAPPDAPQPDCQKPDGCLFCVHHRDIDSFDHVWSLMSLRHLKSLEMARDHIVPLGEAKRPALRVVERITAKLEWYAQNNSERAEWANEAGIRMRERKYHKRWAGWIALAEMAA